MYLYSKNFLSGSDYQFNTQRLGMLSQTDSVFKICTPPYLFLSMDETIWSFDPRSFAIACLDLLFGALGSLFRSQS